MQPTNSVTLPTATGSGTISYAIASLPTGVTLTGNTLTGDPATIAAQTATSYTYIATDSQDNQTASLTFTLEVVDEKAILQTIYNETDGPNWTAPEEECSVGVIPSRSLAFLNVWTNWSPAPSYFRPTLLLVRSDGWQI